MSKSKLNRRQLKKVSRIAADYVLRNKNYVGRDQLIFDHDDQEDFHGEFGFWQRGCGYDYEYSSYSAIEDLFREFFDGFMNYKEMCEEDTPMKLTPPRGFNSISFANKVHYMIKFLEE